ncbi:MAG: tripartite tricarboxylate transporter TctB family protein [Rhodobacteraceae bacterium]|nr:tripartite tricarboxylate transporter TctB family protein [Paracoccaceae bacterium]
MIKSDRILGLVTILVALAYIASAFQIQASFLTDPVGSKTFPILIGAVAALCGLVIFARPDPDPEWPEMSGWLRLALATAVMIGYAYGLKPFGFVLTTALAGAALSWMIQPRIVAAIVTGVGLSAILYAIFKFLLGLGLKPWPAALTG